MSKRNKWNKQIRTKKINESKEICRRKRKKKSEIKEFPPYHKMRRDKERGR